MKIGVYSILSLFVNIIAGALLWLGMVLVSKPNSFTFSKIDRTQWYAFAISLIMAALWWLRLATVFHSQVVNG
jgi:hypothetical protein